MTVCPCPEDGLRFRRGVKPSLKLKLKPWRDRNPFAIMELFQVTNEFQTVIGKANCALGWKHIMELTSAAYALAITPKGSTNSTP